MSSKKRANVIKREEKGSDVNLATHLLNDAWLGKFDCGVVVSNDGDMAEAMRLIRQHHPQKVLGLIKPNHEQKSVALTPYAHFVIPIRRGALEKAQLPTTIPRTKLTKPDSW